MGDLMPIAMRWRGARMTAIVCAAAALSACATFKGKTEANEAPFAENTLAMVSSLRLTVQQPVYLRRFMASDSDVAAARLYGDRIRKLLRGIIVYSLQVAAIGDSKLSEPAKAQELARFLNETLRPAVLSQEVPITLTEAQLDSVLTRVRSQQTYLAALREATPIVVEVVETTDHVVRQFEDRVTAAEVVLSAEVEAEYAPYRANDERLQALEVITMRRFVLLDAARLGDSTAFPALRESYPTAAGSGGRIEPKELDRLSREAFDQLASIRTLRDQMTGESELYANRMKELDELAGQSMITARATRTSIILWSRAHRNMAAGLALPPEIDIVGLLQGVARQVPKL